MSATSTRLVIVGGGLPRTRTPARDGGAARGIERLLAELFSPDHGPRLKMH
ncbi:hypothetical protein [Salinisphaera sp. LB1]|uniref:hypothetical protein n=1 Tax=Salinisphaera sp. LB1 TaxID=2183911 RepID=UPI000D7E11A5|nr:hypothetical protein [Salinisphaera sp. LB1]AWN14784.1 hypothetical protein SALB1_0577 [Salinisphaera sp. LB1]